MDYSPAALKKFKSMKMLDYTSGNCKYTGIWQKHKYFDEIVSYGTTAFFEIGFTGAELLLDADVKGDVMFMIDGKQVAPIYDNLFVFSASDSRHTLKIKIYNDSHIAIRKMFIEANGEFFKIPDKRYIQFIGDSITNCQPGFTLSFAEKTGWDHSNVSQGGMSLCDGFGWYTLPSWSNERIGMESRYFQLEGVYDSPESTPYEFTYCRQPDDIVIFLGTNDYMRTPEHRQNGNFERFVRAYVEFVGKIRKHYPNANIYIMKRVSGVGFCNEAIDEVYKKLCADKKIKLLPSHEWGIEISADNVHPTSNGYVQITDKLIEILK